MNQVRGIFGLGMEDYIGKIAFPAVQVRQDPLCACPPRAPEAQLRAEA